MVGTDELKSLFPELAIESKNEHTLKISNFKGNEDFEIELSSTEDIETIKTIPLDKMNFYKEIFGVFYDNKIEILLDVIDKKRRAYALLRILKEPLEITINYKTRLLKITIVKDQNTYLPILNSIMSVQRTKILLTIENIQEDKPICEDELKDILNCILFDLHYNIGVLFEPINLEIPNRVPIFFGKAKSIPSTLNFTYKKYSTELIEYFKIAQRVDYLPFKYLCYFHILEYLMDKSAYLSASEKIKQIMFKPDFHINMDKYIGEAIKMFKKESDKHQTDLNKIERVISHFIEKEEILDFGDIKNINLSTENSFICNDKTLSLPAIKKDYNKEQFSKNLSKRIYNLRCSIVHSNPDFDEKKAIPFVPSRENLGKLRNELSLIEEVAKLIIMKTAR